MIITKDLYREFDGLIAVDNINLKIQTGEIFGLVGPNGAGKTTLLKMLSSILLPTHGTAFIGGYEIIKDSVEIYKIVGYMPDFFNFYRELKIKECLDYFTCAHNIPEDLRRNRIDRVLEMVGLTEKRDAFIKELSRGMIQRLGLARAIIHDPKIYLLDEPFSGIDPRGRAEIKGVLKKLQGEGKTIVISSHILAELSDFCTSLGIMEKGRIIAQDRVDTIGEGIIEKTLHLKVISSQKEAEEALKNDERVSSLKKKEGDFIFIFRGELEDIATLNERLIKQGIRVVFLAEKRSLEEIYLKISKGGVS